MTLRVILEPTQCGLFFDQLLEKFSNFFAVLLNNIECTNWENIMGYNYNLAYQENRQNWSINQWMKSHGLTITVQEWDNHPRKDEVTQLLGIRKELWFRMTASERGVWAAYWGYVYTQRRPLKAKFWNKMAQIVKNIDQREQAQREQLELIKELRHKRTRKNKDHDDAANGSDLPKVVNVEMETAGVPEVLDIPPWE